MDAQALIKKLEGAYAKCVEDKARMPDEAAPWLEELAKLGPAGAGALPILLEMTGRANVYASIAIDAVAPQAAVDQLMAGIASKDAKVSQQAAEKLRDITQDLTGREAFARTEGDDSEMPAMWSVLRTKALPVMMKLARSKGDNWYMRTVALGTLGALGPSMGDAALDVLIEALGGPRTREYEQSAAARALNNWGADGARAIPALMRLLVEKFPVRSEVIYALSGIGATAVAKVLPQLEKLKPDWELREFIATIKKRVKSKAKPKAKSKPAKATVKTSAKPAKSKPKAKAKTTKTKTKTAKSKSKAKATKKKAKPKPR